MFKRALNTLKHQHHEYNMRCAHAAMQPSQPWPPSSELFALLQSETLSPFTLTPQPAHPALPPTVLLCLWMWLLQGSHGSGIEQCLSFCDCLISLNIRFSRIIHVTACIITSFPFIAESYSIIQIYNILFVHSSVVSNLTILNIALWTSIYNFLWGQMF